MAKRKENLNREKALEQFNQLLIYKPEIFRGTPATLICSGKLNCGRPTEVWEEYVAGLDPTNANSQLKAMIEMRGNTARHLGSESQ